MSVQRRFSGAAALDTPGKRIRFLRLAKGLTQESLARRVFVTQPAVSQWENDVLVPAPGSQKLLAEELDTKRSFLFGDEAA